MANIQEFYEALCASQRENDVANTYRLNEYLLNAFRNPENSDLVMASYIHLFPEKTGIELDIDPKEVTKLKTLIIAKILSNSSRGFSFENEELSKDFKFCVMINMRDYYLSLQFERCQSLYEMLETIKVAIDLNTLPDDCKQLHLLILISNPSFKEKPTYLFEYFKKINQNLFQISNFQQDSAKVNRYFYVLSKILFYFKTYANLTNVNKNIAELASPLIKLCLELYNARILQNFVFDQFIKSSETYLLLEYLPNIPFDLNQISVFDYIKFFPTIISCFDWNKVRSLKESNSNEEPTISDEIVIFCINFLLSLYHDMDFDQIESIVSDFRLLNYCSNPLDAATTLCNQIDENWNLSENNNILRLLLLVSYFHEIPGFSDNDFSKLISNSFSFAIDSGDEFSVKFFFSRANTMRPYTLAPIYDKILEFCFEKTDLIQYGFEFVSNALIDYHGEKYEDFIGRIIELMQNSQIELNIIYLLLFTINGRYLSINLKISIIKIIEQFNLEELFNESPTQNVLDMGHAVLDLYVAILLETQFDPQQTPEFENNVFELIFSKMTFVLNNIPVLRQIQTENQNSEQTENQNSEQSDEFSVDDLSGRNLQFYARCMELFMNLVLIKRNHLEPNLYDILVIMLSQLFETRQFCKEFIDSYFIFVEIFSTFEQIDHPIYSCLAEFSQKCILDTKQYLVCKKFYDNQEEIERNSSNIVLIPFVTTTEQVIEYIKHAQGYLAIFNMIAYAAINNLFPENVSPGYIPQVITSSLKEYSYESVIFDIISRVLFACGMVNFERYHIYLEWFLDQINKFLHAYGYKKELYDGIALLIGAIIYHKGPEENTVEMFNKLKTLELNKCTLIDCEIMFAKYSQDLEQTKTLLSDFDNMKTKLNTFVIGICKELLVNPELSQIHEEVLQIMLKYVNDPPSLFYCDYGNCFMASNMIDLIDFLHGYYQEHPDVFDISYNVKTESSTLTNWFFRYYQNQ
ncbi:hypothetical protein TVAG_114170 [Trichomonas vaginalis G3]|uniref:Uncharacterized protein n=1 Tax=Trichomonas vaginalis (strain ATCC PRA-98 / G3) TaxID=412133 RepID=A2F3U4_TRIV3|nr:hypothetical protein TVAGG3_0281060 [Trichomonas vaginalis G3]EAY00413.1 hypothetical protein TVAG_114170 [Trichomonas vaginalis G3]KAI5526547.1 hypothetical protein TVAGG3_0281060 [Trichomonas vaginalis G3]|eukprot:XP_001313342.1 hypothetical protein [Trichomonas vaginalis G3]